MNHDHSATPVSSTDYFTAQERWVAFWGSFHAPIPSFSNFLGMSGGMKKAKSATSKASIFLIRQSATRKIQLLSGPHHYAALMAYKQRKELK